MLRDMAIRLSCALLFLAAASSSGADIDKLAKDGYWGEADTWANHSKFLNQPAPKLELTEWRGKELKADDLKDKILVVDFWATWCGPCKAAVPHNNETAKKFADKGVLVIGACGARGNDKMNEVADQTKMEYPTAKANDTVVKAWGVNWWPHYVIVDKKGKVRAIGISPDYVEKIITALLEEK